MACDFGVEDDSNVFNGVCPKNIFMFLFVVDVMACVLVRLIFNFQSVK